MISFGKFKQKSNNKPSSQGNGDSEKQRCGRIPGYELTLDRPYEGETDATMTAYRLKPLPPPTPRTPVEQPYSACEVLMEKGLLSSLQETTHHVRDKLLLGRFEKRYPADHLLMHRHCQLRPMTTNTNAHASQ